jgi:hypothetical protein
MPGALVSLISCSLNRIVGVSPCRPQARTGSALVLYFVRKSFLVPVRKSHLSTSEN